MAVITHLIDIVFIRTEARHSPIPSSVFEVSPANVQVECCRARHDGQWPWCLYDDAERPARSDRAVDTVSRHEEMEANGTKLSDLQQQQN